MKEEGKWVGAELCVWQLVKGSCTSVGLGWWDGQERDRGEGPGEGEGQVEGACGKRLVA